MKPSGARLALYLSTSGAELLRTEFVDSDGNHHSSVRSKNEPIEQHCGTFQWGAGVKALTILLLRSAAQSIRGETGKSPVLSGLRKSAANSLDSALPMNNPEKVPAWAKEMFGVIKPHNLPRLPAMLRRENSGHKTTNAPVRLALDPTWLKAENISIFKGQNQIQDPADLETLSEEIERSQPSWTASDPASYHNEIAEHHQVPTAKAKTSGCIGPAEIIAKLDVAQRIDKLFELLAQAADPRGYRTVIELGNRAVAAVLRQSDLQTRTEVGALVASIHDVVSAFLCEAGTTGFPADTFMRVWFEELAEDPWWIGAFVERRGIGQSYEGSPLSPKDFAQFAHNRGDLLGIVYVAQEAYRVCATAERRDAIFAVAKGLDGNGPQAFYERVASQLAEDANWILVAQDPVRAFRFLQLQQRIALPYLRK